MNSKNHPNRGWRGRWAVNAATREASHGPSGLVVRFCGSREAPSQLVLNKIAVLTALRAVHGDDASAKMYYRLMHEATTIYLERTE